MKETFETFLNELVWLRPEMLKLLPAFTIFFVLVVLGWGMWRFRRLSKTKGSRYAFFGFSKRLVFTLCASLCLVLALARPVTQSSVVIEKQSTNIIFALDASLSMRARDLGSLTRLDVARYEIAGLVREGIIHEGDKVSLLVFNKAQKIYLPLSFDIQGLVETVGSVSFPQKLRDLSLFGTDIVSLLEYVVTVLDAQEEVGRIKGWDDWQREGPTTLIIFTDGDDTVDDVSDATRRLVRAVSELRDREIKIYAVGIGTREGVTWMSLLEGYQLGSDHVRADYTTEDITGWSGRVTRLETNMLTVLVELGGGRLYTIENQNISAVEFLRSAIDENRSGVVVPVENDEDRVELWPYLAWTAFFILLLLVI